jgi:hypothetical protein
VTTLDEFIEIFKNTAFSHRSIVRYYRSCIKQYALVIFIPGQAKQKILELEENYQWPILRHLDNPGLEVYRGVKKKRRDNFIRLINREQQMRTQSWKELRETIGERVKFYEIVFDFNEEDISYCRRLAERYERRLLKRKKAKILKTLAIGTGVAGVTGMGMYFYAKIRQRK